MNSVDSTKRRLPVTVLPGFLGAGKTTPQSKASAGASRWQDWIGIVASIACAIHCAAMPFVIAWLPALGLSILADEAFHRWMALACFVIALAAFVPGFRLHRRWTPAAIAIVGLSLITAAAFGIAGDCCAACETPAANGLTTTVCTEACCEHCAAESQASRDASINTVTASFASPSFLPGLATWITPLGGMLLVSAHLLNRRYGCLCGCCETEAG